LSVRSRLRRVRDERDGLGPGRSAIQWAVCRFVEVVSPGRQHQREPVAARGSVAAAQRVEQLVVEVQRGRLAIEI
jgi:hypothetical protein